MRPVLIRRREQKRSRPNEHEEKDCRPMERDTCGGITALARLSGMAPPARPGSVGNTVDSYCDNRHIRLVLCSSDNHDGQLLDGPVQNRADRLVLGYFICVHDGTPKGIITAAQRVSDEMFSHLRSCFEYRQSHHCYRCRWHRAMVGLAQLQAHRGSWSGRVKRNQRGT